MDEQLVRECLRMFRERARHYDTLSYGQVMAYENAATMLEYAIEGNAECLAQFDYFNKSEG